MRFYDIQILETDGTLFAQYTSRFQNQPDPSALLVEFDIPVTTLAVPIGAASVKIWGVSLQTIGQASDFNGKRMKVYAGMQTGLPLANPSQAGLILQGSINQAFGNWINTNQWVEFIVVTDGGLLDQQLNITLNWTAGQTLAAAAQATLAVAAPTYKFVSNVSSDLKLPHDEPGFYNNLIQFAQYLKDVSAAILGGEYSGVEVLITEDTFTIFDGTVPASPALIDFKDLIGQPTWIDPATVQVPLVLRADLSPGDYIKLPPTQVTTTAASLSQYRDTSVFQGSFLVTEVRHIGNSRAADALSWITLVNCAPTGSGGVAAANV